MVQLSRRDRHGRERLPVLPVSAQAGGRDVRDIRDTPEAVPGLQGGGAGLPEGCQAEPTSHSRGDHCAGLAATDMTFGLDQSGILVTFCNKNALLKRCRMVLPVAAPPELEDR